MSSLISWFNLELWGPVWPNLAASAVCATAAVLRIRVHLRRHREVVAQQHAATHALVAGLHERLDAAGIARQEETS